MYTDPSRFTVYAEGDVIVNNENTTLTLKQEVSVSESGEFFINTMVTSTGTFFFHVKEGGGGLQNTCSGGTVQNSFMNSPMSITIVPGAASAIKTIASVPPTVAEGETTLLITLEPRDDFGNPKTLQTVEIEKEEGDTGFEYFRTTRLLDYEEDVRKPITSTTTKIFKTTEGTSFLHIELNGLAIGGSPFAVTTEKELIKMPGLSMVALIIGGVIGGGQLIFFALIPLFFGEKEVSERKRLTHWLTFFFQGSLSEMYT